jgi:hypothetical protein
LLQDVLLTKYKPADQIKKNEMGGERGTDAGKVIQGFGWETWGKVTTWQTKE